jgi:hypothetical protein
MNEDIYLSEEDQIFQIENVIRTLGYLASQIKLTYDTAFLTMENKSKLSEIKYKDDFYNKTGTFDEYIYSICCSCLIIQCCSFIDELEQELNPKKFPLFRKRIILFKKICKPALNRIRKWKDLKNYRNNLIAHNFRINGKSIFSYKNKVEYSIPNTPDEYKLLADLVFLMACQIVLFFPREMNSTNDKKTLYNYHKINSDKSNFKTDFLNIKQQMELIVNTTTYQRLFVQGTTKFHLIY